MMNNRGKTLTIFIVLTIILLVSSTSIGFFLYNKEKQFRKSVQTELETAHYNEMKLQGDLKEARRLMALSEDKAKEADDKINNLMDEMDLNDGVRKELKAENATLKEAIESLKKVKETSLIELQDAKKKFSEVTEMFKSEQDKVNALQIQVAKLKTANEEAEKKIVDMRTGFVNDNGIPSRPVPEKIELDKIVVNPNDGNQGKILSVDKVSDFVVFNLGVKQGVKPADVMSVYRGEEYLGDVRVSRVQEELSAADLIPPFSSRKVRKNDTVVIKP